MKTTFDARIQRLQKKFKHSGWDAFLIERPLDLFYFTGIKLSAGKLLVGSKECRLFVDGRYLQIAKEKSPFPCILDSSHEFLQCCQAQTIKKVGFDAAYTSYHRFLQLEKLEGLSFIPDSTICRSIRAVKDREEIEEMKKSASLLWEGFNFIRSQLKEGISEKAVTKAFEVFCLQKGADGLSFEPIIAFGASGAMPHYHSQDVPLKEGDAVLIDIGVVVDSYHSDMTRVVFFGKEDPRLQRLYEIVKRAQRAALDLCRPGVRCKELDNASRKVMREENVEELFVHSLGHGIGLETHEFPKIRFDGEDKDVVLEAGMVFTVEPGLYMPGIGGVRYEDTIVITSEGYENFYPQSSFKTF